MSFEQISYLAQIVASVADSVFDLCRFTDQTNTRALERNEHNSTMAQWTVIPHGIPGNATLPSS